MNNLEFAKAFKEDNGYYDLQREELRTILSLVDLKAGQRLIDLGTGVGRLALPLSDYVKVTALDCNQELLNQIPNGRIEKVCTKIEDYQPSKKFDFGLIAWPGFEDYREIFKHIKNQILTDEGRLIILKSKQHSLREIVNILFPELFGIGKGFLEVLPDYFDIEQEKSITTVHAYPDLETSLRLVKFDIATFYKRKLDGQQQQILLDFLRKRETHGEVHLRAKVKVLLCKK